MKVIEVLTQPVVSLEEFARSVADKSASANDLGRRAAAYLDTLARTTPRPAPRGAARPVETKLIDLAPAIRAAARDRVIAALAAAVDATELPLPPPLSEVTHEYRVGSLDPGLRAPLSAGDDPSPPRLGPNDHRTS